MWDCGILLIAPHPGNEPTAPAVEARGCQGSPLQLYFLHFDISSLLILPHFGGPDVGSWVCPPPHQSSSFSPAGFAIATPLKALIA